MSLEYEPSSEPLHIYVINHQPSTLRPSKQSDHRGSFDKWFRAEFSEPIALPEDGMVFDYFVDKDRLEYSTPEP